MKQNKALRKQIKKYLQHPKSISQSELERQVGFGKGTISKFLDGMNLKIDHDKYRKLMDIIAPWKFDTFCTAAAFRARLMRERRSEKEIAEIASKMVPKGSIEESVKS